MKISVKNLSFKYSGKKIFENLNVDLEGSGRPIVILGRSGSGKTTLLKLLGGLLVPQEGEIRYSQEGEGAPSKAAPSEAAPSEAAQDEAARGINAPEMAFMFQESRLLPWLTVLENVSLPLRKVFGREEGLQRARHFISLVSLGEKERAYPHELSGGEAQRVSMARAFAWPAHAIFMDEPFQSLDIPLKILLMDNCLSLLEKEKRLLVAVTHDPREAIYLGGRIMVLGSGGFRYDKTLVLSKKERAYGSAGELECEMLEALEAGKPLI